MFRPYRTALMPVGTVIEHDGTTYKKTAESRRDPFPWTTELGSEFGDERIAHLLDDGGRLVEMPYETKTAKDLPPGAEVYGQSITYTKTAADGGKCWTSSTGGCLTDAQIDLRLTDGAFITRVPTGPAKEK